MMDLYGQFEGAHLPRGIDQAGTVRLATFLEKQVRFASCLIMSSLATEETFESRLPRSTGLGGYLGFLRHCAEEIEVLGLNQGLANLARKIDASLAQKATLDGAGLTVKQFRDYVAHAGFVPGDGRFDRALRESVKENSHLLVERVRLMGGTELRGGDYYLGEIPLTPLFISRNGAPAMFQEFQAKEVVYYSLAEESLVCRYRLNRESPVNGILGLLANGKAGRDGSALRLFKDALLEDLKGFAVSGFTKIAGLYAPFVVNWRRVTSDGYESRQDTFRLGLRNEWQWQSGRSWKGYDAFLRLISNWSVIAQRSLQGLNAHIDQWESTEDHLFEADLPLKVPDSIESQISRRDIGGGVTGRQSQGVGSLGGMLDDSASQIAGRPTIFFVTGEAGIGKTYSLMNLTRTRAERLLDDPNEASPLYLYVSCSGTGLKRLRDLINAEVAGTRRLILRWGRSGVR